MEKLSYIIIGLGLAWLPFILSRRSDILHDCVSRIKRFQIPPRRSQLLWILLLAASYASIAWHNIQFLLPLVCLSVVPPLILRLSQGRFNLPCYALSAFCLTTSVRLLWWMNENWRHTIPYHQIALFLIFATGIAWLLMREKQAPTPKAAYAWVLLLPYTIGTVLYAFNSSFLDLAKFFRLTLLHWGAYIGPAQIVAAGGQPLIDIPLQYGLGPTMLIAFGIPYLDSWLWMFILSNAMLVLYALSLAIMLILICRNTLSTMQIGAVLATAFICTFYWSGYPSSGLMPSPMAFPSVQGMRYLPLMLMGLFSIRHALNPGRVKAAHCHLIWCLSLIWSPEAAFYATLVWCPYFLFFPLQKGKFPLGILFKRATILAGWSLSCFIGVMGCFYTVYGALPSWEFFAVYVLNPPGTLPINLKGSVWFFLAVFGSGIYLLVRSQSREQPREKGAILFITLLMLYGTSSYYFLGRSHDNSIANFSPFLLLVISASLALAPKGTEANFAKMLVLPLASLWLLSPWPSTSKLELKSAYSLRAIENKFDYRLAAYNTQQKARLAALSSFDEKEDSVATFFQDPIPPLTDQVWSGLHLYINYVVLPLEIREKALWNVKERLNRPGWLLVDHLPPKNAAYSKEQAIAIYETAYKRGETIRMGDLDAIYFTPLPSEPSAASE